MSDEIARAFAHPDARSTADPADRLSLRDHVVAAEIGAFEQERGVRQRLRFNVVVEVARAGAQTGVDDDVDRILSYDRLTEAIAAELSGERLDLLETLAERIAARILAEPQARRVFLRIEKLDRGDYVLGVEIVRSGGGTVTVTDRPPARIVVGDRPGAAPESESGSESAPLVLVPRAPRLPVPTASGAAARRIALLSLDQAAIALAERAGCEVAATRTELDWSLRHRDRVVWAPSRMVLAAPETPPLDDLAAWLGETLGGTVESAGSLPPICGLDLDRPRVMGILNVTPDSFSDGGTDGSVADAVARGCRMATEADLLDIGGESTRPGAADVPAAEEIARVVPVIEGLRQAGVTTPISIDTRKAEVARAALDAGADMVNDVSAGLFDAGMLPLVAARGVPVCLMHSIGDPQTMQDDPRYDDVVGEVLDHLAARVAAAEAAGIDRARILVDPGIGFGKTLQHNVTLIRHLAAFRSLGVALLFGASRKRFIGTLGGTGEASRRLGGSIAVALAAAERGAHVIRVHDPFETREALRLHFALHTDETP